jgi:hypothetical protein
LRTFIAAAVFLIATLASSATITLQRRYALHAAMRHAVAFDVGEDGRVVVADHDAPAVLSFDPQGNILRSYSHAGSAQCQIGGPRAVAISSEGIAVWDGTRHHLLRFTWDGTCTADDIVTGWEAPNGSMARKGDSLFVAGDAAETPCVFFSVDLRHPGSVRTCFESLPNPAMSILYAREYVALSGASAEFAVPYEAAVHESQHGQPSRARALSNLALPVYSMPRNDIAIRSNRKLFFEFYNGQKLLEGIAGVTHGVVAVTRTPAAGKSRIDLSYYANGGSAPAATANVMTEPATGAYNVSVRGDGGRYVYLLVAHGTWPAPQYEMLVYEIR